MARSLRSGQTFTMLANGSPDHRMCSYMSSVAISTCGCRRNTSPSAASSPREYTPPVGLGGLLIKTSQALGVGDRTHARIHHPVGRGDNHLVARVEQRLREIEKALLAADRYEHLVRREPE